MKLTYQDLRADKIPKVSSSSSPPPPKSTSTTSSTTSTTSTAEDSNNKPTTPTITLECHNDKIGVYNRNEFLMNATLVWKNEIFPPLLRRPRRGGGGGGDDHHRPKDGPSSLSSSTTSSWPSVVYLLIGYGKKTFDFQTHVQTFVNGLPPTWNGTLFLGDLQFSAWEAGFVTLETYNTYKADLTHFLRKLNDTRIRWLDGIGISKEMRMHGEFFPKLENHFHRWCDMDHGEIRVCSNITEAVAQLLLGHAIGQSKSSLIEKISKTTRMLKKNKKTQNPKHDDHHHIDVEYCHACPESLLPLHVTPNPKLTCAKGMLQIRNESQFISSSDKCPQTCLNQPRNGTMTTQSDVVEIRYCSV